MNTEQQLKTSLKWQIGQSSHSSILTFAIIFNCIAYCTTASSQDFRGVMPINVVKQDTSETYAFIIGISDYQNIPDLYYADRDAVAFQEYLLAQHIDSNKIQNISIFLNSQANRVNILDGLSSFLNKPKEGDRVYFYFAGHGDIEDLTQAENGLLLLHGAPSKNYFGMIDEVLQVNQIANYFGKLSSNGIDVVYVIDACHSGKLSGGSKGKTHTQQAIMSNLTHNATLMLSCASNQLSIEGIEWGGGHGLFSYYLYEGLSGIADIDQNREISLLELEAFVKKNTYLESEGKQTPIFYGDQTKIFNAIKEEDWNIINDRTSQKYSEYSKINYKGNELKYFEGNDPISNAMYQEFNTYMEANALLKPANNNAIAVCRRFNNIYENNYAYTVMRRKLITKLNYHFDSIVRPILECKKHVWTKASLIQAKEEIDSCLQLINERHYLYPHMLSRQYYLEALICSHGININNYGPLDAENFTKCINLLHTSRKLEPNAAYIYYSLGKLHQTMLNTDSSMSYLIKFVSLLPNSAVAHNSLGISYGDNNLFRESVNAFQRAIQLDSSFKEAYANLIYIYSQINQFDSALLIAKSGVAVNPLFSGVRNNLSELYLKLGRMDEAKTLIEETMELDSANLNTILLRGKYYYKINDFYNAHRMFEKVLSKKPDYRYARMFLALNYKSQKNCVQAIRILNDFIGVDSKNVRFIYEVGKCYYLNQQFDSAYVQFEKAKQLAGDAPQYIELLGDMHYFYLRQPEQSELYYLHALRMDSFNLDIISKLNINRLYLNKPTVMTNNITWYENNLDNIIYKDYLKLVEVTTKKDYKQAADVIESLIKLNHEMKWRISSDPIISQLLSVPELRNKLDM